LLILANSLTLSKFTVKTNLFTLVNVHGDLERLKWVPSKLSFLPKLQFLGTNILSRKPNLDGFFMFATFFDRKNVQQRQLLLQLCADFLNWKATCKQQQQQQQQQLQQQQQQHYCHSRPERELPNVTRIR